MIMGSEDLLGGLILFSVAVLLLLWWLYAHARWKQRRQDRISLADRHQQLHQLKAVQQKGIDQAMIDALPIFIHTDHESLQNLQAAPEPAGKKEACSKLPSAHGLECSVCLSEFLPQERGRELPICRHRFHIDCIDPWLRANATCPVCRTSCGARGGDAEVEVLQVINDQTSVGGNMGVQYPTNVLFWGSNTRIISHVSLDGLQQPSASSTVIQIYSRELPLEAPSSSAPSLPAATPSPPSIISTLNPLRRLLSREMHIGLPIGSHSYGDFDPPTHTPKA